MTYPEPTARQYVEWAGDPPGQRDMMLDEDYIQSLVKPDCPTCKGTGRNLEPHGETTWCHCARPPFPTSCPVCHGKGWDMMGDPCSLCHADPLVVDTAHDDDWRSEDVPF